VSELKVEREFLDSHKDELLRTYGAKYLVISGQNITGAYDTMQQALEGAAIAHGMNSVLIRRPAEAKLEFSAPAFTLGILRADSIHTTAGQAGST
jgi:hypothetical protein